MNHIERAPGQFMRNRKAASQVVLAAALVGFVGLGSACKSKSEAVPGASASASASPVAAAASTPPAPPSLVPTPFKLAGSDDMTIDAPQGAKVQALPGTTTISSGRKFDINIFGSSLATLKSAKESAKSDHPKLVVDSDTKDLFAYHYDDDAGKRRDAFTMAFTIDKKSYTCGASPAELLAKDLALMTKSCQSLRKK